MCAIAGIVNLSKKTVDEKNLKLMIRVVKYRGPDDEGFFVDKNIGLGHARLSILDLSSAGHQPMHYKNLTIIYNGEIYNYLELKKQLKKRGHKFKSKSDTEVILHAYEEWGEKCLNKFNGMWAFAIWNSNKKEIFCSRDRFGIKPFYYYFDQNNFIFASEIKQILEVKHTNPKPDDETVYNYLVYGFENYSERTFFKNIKQLPGGHYLKMNLSLKNLKPFLNKWYLFKDSKSNLYSFDWLLRDSIKIRLRSDVPVGSCLSGGLDSSTIVVLANNILQSNKDYHQEVFTAVFKNHKNIDESIYAQKVINKTGCIKNFVYPNDKTLREDLEKLIWHQEEPFGGLSIFSQWCVMKKAKEKNIKVLLDGQGGDELFLGYERYYIYFLKQSLKKLNIFKFLSEFYLISQNSKLDFKALIQYYIYFSLPSFRLFKLHQRSGYFLDKNFAIAFKNKMSVRKFMHPKNLLELQKNEIFYSQLPHLLRYEDKNSMAFSVETRLPFLDYRLVEFVYSLPEKFKIQKGWTKYILRKSTKGILPDDIRWRKNKIGFEVPQVLWLKKLDPGITDLFKKNFLSKKYIDRNLFLKNFKNNRMSNLELWMRKFLN